MNILEAIGKAAQAPDDSVLVAKPPFTWGAEALFAKFTEDYRVPDYAINLGYEYFLGLDDINELLGQVRGKKMSERAIAEFIIFYAIYDSYPAWIDDIPNL